MISKIILRLLLGAAIAGCVLATSPYLNINRDNDSDGTACAVDTPHNDSFRQLADSGNVLAGFSPILPVQAATKSAKASAKTPASTSTKGSAKASASTSDKSSTKASAKTSSKAAPSGKVTIFFDANGGVGMMGALSVTEGSDVTLPANTFTRKGYVFLGWTTNPRRKGNELDDQATIHDASAMKLYAAWEPQMYIIHFNGNRANYGEMNDIYGIYDTVTHLPQNRFTKSGHRFGGWSGPNQKSYANQDDVLNLDVGNTASEKVITVDAGKPKNKKYKFKSTQGSCVFAENGKLYLVTAASINDAAYNKGDTSHYETILTKYDLSTGKAVARARNLPFDHGNGICYNEDNGHLYIAEGGTYKGYPSGVLEVDENLKKVKQWDFPLLTNIWGIAYADHHFYLIGKNEDSRNSFCVLNEDMDTLAINPVDEYYSQHYSSQGIAADDNFIYAVSACFNAYEWKSKQRINVFDHDGNYIGVWTIDIPNEAEDITVIDGVAYITTNEKNKSTLYETLLPSVTLSAVWKK